MQPFFFLQIRICDFRKRDLGSFFSFSGCDLCFTDNDVDIVIQKTKKALDTKRKKKKKKRCQEKRKEGKGPGPNNYEEGPGASKYCL